MAHTHVDDTERRSRLRDELIQVAAVAVAFVTDLDQGSTNLIADDGGFSAAHRHAINDVVLERIAQEHKWGKQHHTPMEWLAILGEEVGEANTAALEAHEWPARQQTVYDETDTP